MHAQISKFGSDVSCFLASQHRKLAVAAIALLKKNLNKVKSAAPEVGMPR